MKIKLKYKLLIMYTSLIMILIFSLISVSSYIFKINFDKYVLNNRLETSEQIVSDVLQLFQDNETPSYDDLYKIGVDALDDGLILMVNTDVDNQLLCISDIIPNESNKMLSKMESTLESVYPYVEGEYKEEKYIIEDETGVYGYVTLGYYGPIYYTEFDVIFLKAVKSAISIIGFIFFVITSIIVYFFAKSISEPIQKVSKKAYEIGKGNYGETIKMESNIEDIEDLVKSINSLGDKLEMEQQIKKQLSINYTHELRTPLTCALTTLEGMEEGVFPLTTEKVRNLRNEIKQIYTMVENVDELLETSNKEVKLVKTNFDFNKLINQCIGSFASSYEGKEIKIKYNVEELKDCFIYADEEKVKSVVSNLLSNALKYTDERGKVEITLKKSKEGYIFTVEDDGIGIEVKEQLLIFEHLYRIDKSRVKKVEGFGIGLSICKNIVEAHGGEIKVKSELDNGSKFIVYLPNNIVD